MFNSRLPRSVRWIRQVVVFILGLVSLLAFAGAGYQAIGTWLDTRRFPQRGRTVQAGLIKMNIYCTGSGAPTVILEQGGGMPGLGWMKIQPMVAEFTRVCSYDRAGYGWSEPGPMPRTIPEMAKELKTLLDASEEMGPFVMVAASLGGPIVRLYTGLYPIDVAGLVLVDASHEDQQKRLETVQPAELIEENRREIASYERWEKVRRPFRLFLGIERFETHFTQQSPLMPQVFWEEYLYLSQRPNFRETAASEVRSLPASSDALRLGGNLGDRPLIVLTGGKMMFTPQPFLTREIEDKVRNLWINGLQAEQAHLSTHGKQIVVPDSGHEIMFERPDAVVDAVRQVWSEAKQRH